MDADTISMLERGIEIFLKMFFAKEVLPLIITSIAIAAVTFGFVDIFMYDGLKATLKRHKMTLAEAGAFTVSLVMVLGTVLIAVVAIVTIGTPRRGMSMLGNFRDMGTAVIIAMGFMIGTSLALKPLLPAEDRKGWFLLAPAIKVIVRTLSSHIVEWITVALMGAANVVIKIIHRPLILEYAIVAVILNLLLSFALVAIMGVSNAAGAANLFGSVLGGALHALIRRKRVKELAIIYAAEEKKTLDAQNAQEK